MAVSDVLSDAACEIRRYLADGDWYEEYRLDLERLLIEMDRIRIELDTPPDVKGPAH